MQSNVSEIIRKKQRDTGERTKRSMKKEKERLTEAKTERRRKTKTDKILDWHFEGRENKQ
jgi:hypothetical protein